VRADDLAAHVIAKLVERNPQIPVESITDVILGCANQAGEDNRNVARMALLLAGLPTIGTRRDGQPALRFGDERGCECRAWSEAR
jgi:acetyl-CoA acetyltransferase